MPTSRLAILSDIHGNLPALEATLADIAKHDIQTLLCLGDVATFGPQPKETLLKIKSLSCPVIMGNGDIDISNSQPINDSSWETDISNWRKMQLYKADRTYIQTFQSSIRLELCGLNILAYHGSPQSFNDSITATTPYEILESDLVNFQADIYVGGHTHEQSVRRFGNSRLLNPGSVGLPLVMKGRHGLKSCVEEYAILEILDEQPNLTFSGVCYDLKTLEISVRQSGMPHAKHYLDWL